jgi:hypothetical protein
MLLAWAAYCIAHTPELAVRYVRLLVLPVFVSCVAMISWGSWRFRLPGDVGLIAFCTTATVKIIRANLAKGNYQSATMRAVREMLGPIPYH